MKILVLGDGEHGKGTFCKLLKEAYNLTSMSSSMFAAERFLFEKLRLKYGYESFDECYDDRRNKRSEWFEEIKNYNGFNLARLATELTSQYDIYDGMRNIEEFDACQIRCEPIFDLVIYIDASKRLPAEIGSMTIPRERADIVIENNGSINEFKLKILRVMSLILGKQHIKEKIAHSESDYILHSQS